MQVQEMLDNGAVRYEVLEHKPVFTAQKMAQEEHVHGMNVAKPVIVNADGRFYMCVVAACCKINLDALRLILQADELRMATEAEMIELFPDCEIGAESPFGCLYGLPTIMDDRLEQDEYIVFQSGTHDRAVRLSMKDYLKIERPRIFSFSFHV